MSDISENRSTEISHQEVRILTSGNIFKQLLRLAAPIMATGFVQMAYTLADMAWIGRLGSKEVAAVGAIGIVFWMVSSLALLPKIGAEISIARAIGIERLDIARQYASHTVTVAIIMGLFFGLLSIVFSTQIVSLFSLEADVAQVADEYMQIVFASLPFVFLTFTFSGVYNGVGRTDIPFLFFTAGLIVNIILDPILIFVAGWNTGGAAIATVFSEVLVAGLFIYKLRRRKGILNRFPFFTRLTGSYIVGILKLGTPVAAMNCFYAAISFYIAHIASIFGGYLGVMSQTTGGQIEGITWNTSQGFSTALGTFVAQNHAAGKISRTRKAYKYTLLLLLSLGVAVTFAFIFFGEDIFGVLVPEPEAQISGGIYLKYIAISQVFIMLEITTFGMWNGYGRTLPPATVSIVFNLLRIPAAFALASVYGIIGVWLSLSLSSVVKGIVSAGWWALANNKRKRKTTHIPLEKRK
jgi:putative MATE family efflux protein